MSLGQSTSRAVVFVAVGVLGFGLQLVALEALTSGLGMAAIPAIAVAVELAILHNFVWHERWTWGDRAARDPGGSWLRLGRFHATSGVVSLAGNVAVTAWIVEATGAPLLVANTLAVGACTVVNFVAADRLVFRRGLEVEA